MRQTLADMLRGNRSKNALVYLAKATVLLLLLYTTSKLLPQMPPALVAVCWALASAYAATGIVYQAVARKLHKQSLYQNDGRMARLNAGRTLRMVGGYVLAAVFVAGLFVESPAWDAQKWILAASAIPLYLAVSIAVGKWVSKEYRPQYRLSRTIAISTVATSALLCAVAFALLKLSPLPAYSTAAEAFLATKQPLAGSPSALLAEAGLVSSLSSWFSDYAASSAGEAFSTSFFLLRCALFASAAFGVVTLIGSCSLKLPDARQIFSPIAAGPEGDATPPVNRKYVAIACVLPLLLAGAFLAADAKMHEIAQSGEHTRTEQFVHDQVNLAVYQVDGKYLDATEVDGLLAQTLLDADALGQEAHDELAACVNRAFDARLENVDAYLDWYYSLPADYAQLASLVTGSAEEFAAEQFEKHIEEGVDDSQLGQLLEKYAARTEELQAEYEEALEQCEIVEEVPEWALTVVEPKGGIEALDFGSIEPAQRILDAPQRLGISTASGVVVGLIAKKLVGKAAEKQFFKQVVKRVGSKLASGGIAAGVGAVAGSAGGPAGALVGAAAAVAAAVGVDYVILMVDEYANRDDYRQQIVDAIEQQRAKVLAQLA